MRQIILLFIMSLIFISGCEKSENEKQTGEHQTGEAKKHVENSKGDPLDTATINSIVRAAKLSDVHEFKGKVFEIHGSVLNMETHQQKSEAGESGWVHLDLHDPDYEGVNFVRCHFTLDDWAAVEALQIKQWVGIKGEFDSASPSQIDLIGCVLEAEPAKATPTTGVSAGARQTSQQP